MPTLAEELAAKQARIEELAELEAKARAEAEAINGKPNSRSQRKTLEAQAEQIQQKIAELRQAEAALMKQIAKQAEKPQALPGEEANKGGEVVELEVEEQDTFVDASPGGSTAHRKGVVDERSAQVSGAVKAPQSRAAMFSPKPELEPVAADARGLADICCPFEKGYARSRIASAFLKPGVSQAQTYMLLALIREALYLTFTGITAHDTEKTVNFVADLALDKLIVVDELVKAKLASSDNPQTAWGRVAQALAGDEVRQKLGLKVSRGDMDKVMGSVDPYLQRLPRAFHYVFEAFKAQDNCFEANATVLNDGDLAGVMQHPLKMLYMDVLFYLFSLHLHYDEVKVAHDNSGYVAALKERLRGHSVFDVENVKGAVFDRLKGLEAARYESNGTMHNFASFLTGRDPNGNFGMLLTAFKRETEEMAGLVSDCASTAMNAK